MGKRTLVCTAVLLSGATLMATDYLMEGGDPQRTGWLKDERVFTTANVGSSTLLWTVKLDNATRSMHNLFPPMIAEGVATADGPREIGVVAGVSDNLYGIDVATGRVLWHRQFDNTFQGNTAPGDNVLCPGGLTDVPVLAQAAPGRYTVYIVSWDGRLRQVNLADGQDVAPPENFMPANGKPYALTLVDGVIYTATSQGCGGVSNGFYSYDLATRKASFFTPGAGGLWGRRGVTVSPEGVAYLGSGDGSFNPTQRVLGNSLIGVKLDANKQLQLDDYFAPPDANWLFRRDLDMNVSPVSFDFQNRKFLAMTSKACKVWLLDRESLGGDDHRTPLYTTPLICNDDQGFDARGVWGAMATWEVDNQRYLAVPFWGPVSRTFKAPTEHSRPKGGGVATFRVEQAGGQWRLAPVWLSRDMDMAEEVVYANGIAFTYAAGADQTQVVQERAWDEPGGGRVGGGLSSGAARRIPLSRRAVIYALDAQTGRELWSSGDQIASWAHFSGITVANGRIYLGTFDGMLYAFGVAR
jgi:hypothetical protein